MEEYIAEVKRIYTDYFGEQGLGEKIGNYVRDGMICDTVKRIQDDSSSPDSVCLELQDHLLYEQVCCAALKKLVELVETEEQEQRLAVCRAILDASNSNGTGLILNAMENHANNSFIQAYGAQILGKLILYTDPSDDFFGYLERTIHALLSALVKFPEEEQVQETLFRIMRRRDYRDHAIMACLSALEQFPENEQFQETIFRVVRKFKFTPAATHDAIAAIGIPACFAALRRYPDNYHIVDVAFLFLCSFKRRESFAAFVRKNQNAREIVQNAVGNRDDGTIMYSKRMVLSHISQILGVPP